MTLRPRCKRGPSNDERRFLTPDPVNAFLIFAGSRDGINKASSTLAGRIPFIVNWTRQRLRLGQ
jgi:hypothetical protein